MDERKLEEQAKPAPTAPTKPEQEPDEKPDEKPEQKSKQELEALTALKVRAISSITLSPQNEFLLQT